MAFTLTITPQKSTSLDSTATHGRCQASKHDLIHLQNLTWQLPELLSEFSLAAKERCKQLVLSSIHNLAASTVQPAVAPLPSNPSPGSWKIWIIGTIMTTVLSFSKGKWGPLLKLDEIFKRKIDAIEGATNIVGNVAAGTVEQAAKGISHNLPEGSVGIIGIFYGVYIIKCTNYIFHFGVHGLSPPFVREVHHPSSPQQHTHSRSQRLN